ncbi:MAG: hypothetical protein AAFU78_12325, partial [Cyanobacteria bacterium J06633_2]
EIVNFHTIRRKPLTISRKPLEDVLDIQVILSFVTSLQAQTQNLRAYFGRKHSKDHALHSLNYC